MSPSSRRAWIEIPSGPLSGTWAAVALLAEGVDRNCAVSADIALSVWSPSSRRAWIEIHFQVGGAYFLCVALLAEGVDRNVDISHLLDDHVVALLAEGVDRNALIPAHVDVSVGRPPRGGRG